MAYERLTPEGWEFSFCGRIDWNDGVFTEEWANIENRGTFVRQQFTGKRTADFVEIYEGDLLILPENTDTSCQAGDRGQVFYDEQNCVFLIDYLIKRADSDCEVLAFCNFNKIWIGEP